MQMFNEDVSGVTRSCCMAVTRSRTDSHCCCLRKEEMALLHWNISAIESKIQRNESQGHVFDDQPSENETVALDCMQSALRPTPMSAVAQQESASRRAGESQTLFRSGDTGMWQARQAHVRRHPWHRAGAFRVQGLGSSRALMTQSLEQCTQLAAHRLALFHEESGPPPPPQPMVLHQHRCVFPLTLLAFAGPHRSFFGRGPGVASPSARLRLRVFSLFLCDHLQPEQLAAGTMAWTSSMERHACNT